MDKNPCCCIPLRKGVIIIAIIDIVIGALGAGLGIFAIFATVLSTPGPTSSTPPPDEIASKTKPSQSFVGLLLILFVIYCIFQVGFGGLLIFGLMKGKVYMLKAWLGFRASGALFTLGTLIAFAVLGSEATIQPGLVDGLSLLFSVYCLFAVYIYATQLQPPSIKNLKPFNSGNINSPVV